VLEAETIITQLPVLDREFYRKQVAGRLETLHAQNKPHSNYYTYSEIGTLQSIKTKLKTMKL